MSAASLAQYAAFLLIVTLLVRPVGAYLAHVFSGERTWLDPVMRPLERAIYRLAGVDPAAEMDWKRYAGCFVDSASIRTLSAKSFCRSTRQHLDSSEVLSTACSSTRAILPIR